MSIRVAMSILITVFFSTGYLWADPYSELKSKVGGLYSSFSANFNYTSSSGAATSGKMYYKSPNKIHLKMGNGKVIATNGQHIWFFNPGSSVCAKQEVGGASGGLLGLLSSYGGSKRGNTYVFSNPAKHYQEISVRVSSGSINVRMAHNSEYINFSFSDFKPGRAIPAGYFNFRPPPSVRIIENPLNR